MLNCSIGKSAQRVLSINLTLIDAFSGSLGLIFTKIGKFLLVYSDKEVDFNFLSLHDHFFKIFNSPNKKKDKSNIWLEEP